VPQIKELVLFQGADLRFRIVNIRNDLGILDPSFEPQFEEVFT
jgi:hypothetical protein